MSAEELAEAGVLGLEDCLLPAESDSISEPRSTPCVRETKASDNGDGQHSEAGKEADTKPTYNRPDLLTELRKVRVLDELIMEENLKIHTFRNREKANEELSESKPSDTHGPSINKEREVFQLQLEREKMEVDKLEKSLGKEYEVKKQKDTAIKIVVKCSVMEKARTENGDDQALCNELLLSTYNRSQRTHSCKNTCEAEVLGPDGAEEATSHGLVQLPDLKCQDSCSEAEPSGFVGTTSDLKAPLEEMGLQPQGCILVENPIICKPEASLTPEMRPDDGAFDPGGQWHPPPVPKPRNALLSVKDNLVDDENFVDDENLVDDEGPHSTELQIPRDSLILPDTTLDELPETATSAVGLSLVHNANVKEHSKNNNNNCGLPEESNLSSDHFSEITTEDKEDTSVVPACLPQADSHAAEENKNVSPVNECPPQGLPPAQPLVLQPCGEDQPKEDLADGIQSSECLRVSGSGSPGIQAQLYTREVLYFV